VVVVEYMVVEQGQACHRREMMEEAIQEFQEIIMAAAAEEQAE